MDIDYAATCGHAVGLLAAKGRRRLALLMPRSGHAGNLGSERGFLEAGERLRAQGVETLVAHHDGSVPAICRTLDKLTGGAEPVTGLLVAILSGHWMMHQLYARLFVPAMALMWMLGALGKLPRTKPSVQFEGYERRVFYGAVWTVTVAQVALWGLWKGLPRGLAADAAMLVAFAAIIAGVAWMSWRGYLPRTRPIVPGQPITID